LDAESSDPTGSVWDSESSDVTVSVSDPVDSMASLAPITPTTVLPDSADWLNRSIGLAVSSSVAESPSFSVSGDGFCTSGDFGPSPYPLNASEVVIGSVGYGLTDLLSPPSLTDPSSHSTTGSAPLGGALGSSAKTTTGSGGFPADIIGQPSAVDAFPSSPPDSASFSGVAPIAIAAGLSLLFIVGAVVIFVILWRRRQIAGLSAGEEEQSPLRSEADSFVDHLQPHEYVNVLGSDSSGALETALPAECGEGEERPSDAH
jgi:hypothetical protein